MEKTEVSRQTLRHRAVMLTLAIAALCVGALAYTSSWAANDRDDAGARAAFLTALLKNLSPL